MKHLFLLLFAFFALLAPAQTIEVEGFQSGVWDADTVKVIGDVKIADSLMITPGTFVLFDGFYGISVEDGASLIALGEPNDSIVFTVNDTTGFWIYNSYKGGWNGFQLMNAGKFRMDYCLLQYGKAADTLDQHGGAMNIYMSDDVEITNTTFNCNFAREHGGAIHAVDSKLHFSHCAINNNKVYTGDDLYFMYGGGARFLKCDVVMTDMEFLHNYGEITIGGAMSLDSCTVSIDRAVFAYNEGLNGAGFYLMRCNDKKCRLSNLLLHDNHAFHFAGGMAFADASPDVYNVTVTRNCSDGVNCNGVFYYMESQPKMYNCIVSGNYPNGLGVAGDTIQQWIWTYNEFCPEFYNCLFEEGLNQFTGAQNIKVYENVIDSDPGFVDPENGDFHLTENSPCRDAGYEQTPADLLEAFDLGGWPRLANGRIDLGPYEFSPAAVGETHVQDAAVLLGNPMNMQSKLILQLERPGEVLVRLVSVLGRPVAEKSFGRCDAGMAELFVGDMSANLSKGLYLMEVVTNERTITLKTIK